MLFAFGMIVRRPTPLDAFFRPQNIVLVGATEEPSSVGRSLLENLRTAPTGRTTGGRGIYPVNPGHATVSGLTCYPNIGAVPAKVDLAGRR
jgi:acetyltransferase